MNNNYIEQKKNTHLYFKIGESTYAINTKNILEIMKLPALDYPQKLPNNIIGLIKYNNFVINVVDIRFYLNIEVNKYDLNNELLIVKTDETIFGIITDKIIGIIPFESSMVDTIPFIDNKTIIDSLYKYNHETVFIINLYAIENLLKGQIDVPEVCIPDLFPNDKESREIMQKRTLALADKSSFSLMTEELHTKKKLISFNLNNDMYCIMLDYVKEVLKDTSITNVPGVPDFIEGIMNLRGDYITVLNLKTFLNMQKTEQNNEKNPVIIVKYNEMELAFLIDKINELFEVQEEKIANTGDSYFAKEFIYNSTPYTMINVEKVFTDKKIIIADM